MSDLPASKSIIQTEECQFRMPVSENLLTRIGGNLNYLLKNIVLSVQNNTGTTFSSGSETTIPFATVVIDSDTAWDGNFWTNPSDGEYLIITRTNSTHGGTAGGENNTLRIKKNSSILLAEDLEGDGSGKLWDSECCFTLVSLIQSDTINCTMQPTRSVAGATLNSAVGANTLIIVKIG